MTTTLSPEVRLERILAGLQAQLERSKTFLPTLDLAAAATAYRDVVLLLEPQLPTLRAQAGLAPEPGLFARWSANLAARHYADRPVPSELVLTYWNQPIGPAPPLVQACVAQLRRVYPQLRVLDGAGVRELIEVPDRIADLLETDRPAHFSDYVRTRILAEHGGLWFDATSWVHRNLDDDLTSYLRAGTVFPRWTAAQIGNWFIASQPRTPLITLQWLALDAWWSARDDLPDYFLYHRIFEVLHALVPEVRGQWDATPALSATQAHLLQLQMMQPRDPARIRAMLEHAPLQKLSYKYDTVPAGSVLERLLTGADLA